MTREQYSTSSAGSTLRRQCAPVRRWARMTLNRGEKKWLAAHAPLPEKVTDRPNRRLWCPSTLRLSDGVVSCVALRRPNGARVGRVQHLRPGASPLLCHGRPVTDSMLSLISLKSHSTSAKMARANECACMRSPLHSFPPLTSPPRLAPLNLLLPPQSLGHSARPLARHPEPRGCRTCRPKLDATLGAQGGEARHRCAPTHLSPTRPFLPLPTCLAAAVARPLAWSLATQSRMAAEPR